MRPVAVAVAGIVAAVAGVMVFAWQSGGDCPGGAEFRSEQACVASGRPAERCRALLAEAHVLLARSGPVYSTREQCQDQHGTCQESRTASGFSPRASGFCLMQGPPERIVPRFGR